MDLEKRAFYIGIPVMILGIVILLFTLVQAFALIGNAGDYMRQQMPPSGTDTGNPPEAGFFYQVDNFTVTFQDTSSETTSPITSWDWNFGDGQGSSEPDPTHDYGSEGTYYVRLTLRDSEDRTSRAATDVRVGPGESGSGSGFLEPGYGQDFSMDFGTAFMPIAIALLAALLYVVMFLVGGSVTKAGWNLIRPRPQTVKVRVKPKDIEVEPVAHEQAPLPETPAPPAPPEEASDTVQNPQLER